MRVPLQWVIDSSWLGFVAPGRCLGSTLGLVAVIAGLLGHTSGCHLLTRVEKGAERVVGTGGQKGASGGLQL